MIRTVQRAKVIVVGTIMFVDVGILNHETEVSPPSAVLKKFSDPTFSSVTCNELAKKSLLPECEVQLRIKNLQVLQRTEKEEQINDKLNGSRSLLSQKHLLTPFLPLWPVH